MHFSCDVHFMKFLLKAMLKVKDGGGFINYILV